MDANTSFRNEDRSFCQCDVALQSSFPSTALQGKGDPQSQVVRDVDPASSRPHGQGPRPGRIFGGRSGNVGFTWYRVGLDRGWDASDVVGAITKRPQGSGHCSGGRPCKFVCLGIHVRLKTVNLVMTFASSWPYLPNESLGQNLE